MGILRRIIEYKTPDPVPPGATTDDVGNVSTVTGANTSDALEHLDAQKIEKNADIVGATKTKITYDVSGLVTAGTDATTDDILNNSTVDGVTDSDALEHLDLNKAEASITITSGNGYITGGGNLTTSQVLTANMTAIATDIKMNGTQALGASGFLADAAHVHPNDTSKEDAFTKNTAFNKNYSVTATDIKMNGVQALGSNDTLARSDHVHPSDATKTDLATLTTKGDLYARNASEIVRLPVGSDGAVLIADSTTDAGLSYSTDIAPLSGGAKVWINFKGDVGAARTVSSLTSSGTIATLTTNTAHGLSVGDYITVSGADQSAYNIQAMVESVPTTTSLTYNIASTAVSPATGTIIYSENYIRSSYGVDYIVDNGVGDWDIYFLNSFTTNGYAAVLGSNEVGNNHNTAVNTRDVDYVNIINDSGTDAKRDTSYVAVAIFGE
jgi:hypothetical protein